MDGFRDPFPIPKKGSRERPLAITHQPRSFRGGRVSFATPPASGDGVELLTVVMDPLEREIVVVDKPVMDTCVFICYGVFLYNRVVGEGG